MNMEIKTEYMSRIDSVTMAAMPKLAFTGRITTVSSITETDRAVEYMSKYSVVGFDTETKPIFKKGVTHLPSLLQLSVDKQAYLFRLSEIGIPASLMQLLENPDITKVGAAVHDDIKALKKLRRIKPEGFIDLQKIVEEYGIEEKSVQKIAAIVLGMKISKSQRLTNWANPALTLSQKTYAATDAWVCREIYIRLKT